MEVIQQEKLINRIGEGAVTRLECLRAASKVETE